MTEPATDDVATLRDEFRSFRQGLVGTPDFPNGELQQIKAAIAAGEVHRAADVAELHKRLDEQNTTMASLPDVVVAKINGTYVKTTTLDRLIDARIALAQGAGRLRKLAEGWKFGGAVLTLLLATVLSVVITNLLHVGR